jgi:hypothetical protein
LEITVISKAVGDRQIVRFISCQLPVPGNIRDKKEIG